MNEYIKNLHDRYGPYVRIGELVYIVTSLANC